MARFLGKTVGSADIGILVLRLTVSSMMLIHGYGKLLKVLSGNWRFANPIGIGAGPSLILTTAAEFFCMLLICFFSLFSYTVYRINDVNSYLLIHKI